MNNRNVSFPIFAAYRTRPYPSLFHISTLYQIFFENLVIIPTFAVQNSGSMSKVCVLTGKRPISGNSVSHSNIKTKRRFLPNLQKKRFFLAEEDKWVTLKVSTEGIRTINKNGLYAVVKELRKAGEKI